MKWVRLVLLLPTFMFTFNAMAGEAERLVGTWYGEGRQDEEEHHWLIVRDADGHFEQQYLFLYHDVKQYELIRESGRWQYDGDVYQETNEEGDQVTYRVVELNDEIFSYQFMDQEDDEDSIIENKKLAGFELGKPPANYSSARLEPEAY